MDKFTKENAEEVKTAVNEMFEAIPKSRRMEYVGHLNEIFLFIEAAQRVAPSKQSEEKA